MEVKLINYTPEPDKICAAAMEIINELDEERIKKILRKTVGSGHHSVIEHASFTFSISGVSRSLTHQLVRHRIASYVAVDTGISLERTVDGFLGTFKTCSIHPTCGLFRATSQTKYSQAC